MKIFAFICCSSYCLRKEFQDFARLVHVLPGIKISDRRIDHDGVSVRFITESQFPEAISGLLLADFHCCRQTKQDAADHLLENYRFKYMYPRNLPRNGCQATISTS